MTPTRLQLAVGVGAGAGAVGVGAGGAAVAGAEAAAPRPGMVYTDPGHIRIQYPAQGEGVAEEQEGVVEEGVAGGMVV